MDADPNPRLSVDEVVLYTMVITVNGLWYVAVVAVLEKLWVALKAWDEKK